MIADYNVSSKLSANVVALSYMCMQPYSRRNKFDGLETTYVFAAESTQ
jgi:hypothetical protein